MTTPKFPIKYSSCTNHPELYDGCYWSNFIVENEDMFALMQPIFENRNTFADRYALISQPDKVPEYVYEMAREQYSDGKFDHVEFYKDINNDWIIVNSPYGNGNDEWSAKNRWTKIEPIYNDHASSYVLKVRNKTSSKTKPK